MIIPDSHNPTGPGTITGFQKSSPLLPAKYGGQIIKCAKRIRKQRCCFQAGPGQFPLSIHFIECTKNCSRFIQKVYTFRLIRIGQSGQQTSILLAEQIVFPKVRLPKYRRLQLYNRIATIGKNGRQLVISDKAGVRPEASTRFDKIVRTLGSRVTGNKYSHPLTP
ncbi:hypothetical protein M084_1700 [Bacteroides fragilis str. 3988 T1]|nr:hypothetical protein M084_1700 [Bacteroides fragilis str. 3988 T1]